MGLLKLGYGAARGLPKLATLAGVGWITYSASAVPHEVALPRPVPGQAGHIDSVTAGRVAVYEMGPDEGLPVVLVHGVHAAASAYDIRPLYTGLAARGRRVIALDLPGFGHSDRTDRSYTPAVMQAAIRDVIEQVAEEPVDLVSLSLGSEFAAKAATERPDLVRSLAMISPTGFGPANRGSSGSTRFERVLRSPLVGQAAFDLIVSRPSIGYFLGMNFEGEIDGGYRSFAWLTAHQPGARLAPAAFLSGALFDPDVLDNSYARVTQPTLVVHDRDPHASFARLPESISEFGWSASRVGPSNGLPHFELPDVTIEALEGFWAASAAAV